MRLLKSEASKSVIDSIPLWPARSDSQNASRPIPFGATIPIPVMTTRLRFLILIIMNTKPTAGPRQDWRDSDICSSRSGRALGSSRRLGLSDTQRSRRTLAPTLNPVIIFLWQSSARLFTKFASYSQIAACAPEKTISLLPGCPDDSPPFLIPLSLRHAPSCYANWPIMTVSTDLPQILVIDDEMGPRESLRMLLKPDYQVHTADCVEAGIKLLKENQPDTIVMDIRMPGVSGIEGLRQIREIDPNLSVIMLTGFGALETAKEALRLGANDYISKPFDAHEMQQVINRNVERTRAHRTSEHAASEIKELNNRLLQQLAQKERLAALGQASAEFVHDLGNPLTIVWGYVQLLAKRLEESGGGKGSGEGGGSVKEFNIIEQNVRLWRGLLTVGQS